jgi:hypothetical protein
MTKALTWLAAALIFSGAAFASPLHCTFEKKDPQGTIEDVMFRGFDYTTTRNRKQIEMTGLDLGAADGYQLDGKAFPESLKGDLNPNYAGTAARHKGYIQFRNFKAIESDVRFSHFEVLIKGDNARIILTTTDGVYTEELFTCN